MPVRRATTADAQALVDLRLAMWDEMHPHERSDAAMRDATDAWLRAKLPSEEVRAWIAEESGRAIGVAFLLVHEHPPRIRGRELRGYVTAVFVERAFRRRGHCGAMMKAIVDHAREEDMRRLMLRPSKDGRAVYETAGFSPMEVLAVDF
jgi:GNAT superfamily N-acetyltransferase